MSWTSVELCAGGGGQAVGLEGAGFQHRALIEIDHWACETLRLNRPAWDVREQDLWSTTGAEFRGIDLLAAGIPCPPFSVAGRQLGASDERDLFPALLRIVKEALPKAVLVENVPGLLSRRFRAYRIGVTRQLERLGYQVRWTKLNASDHGVPQLRPRTVVVALQPPYNEHFAWPTLQPSNATVGDVLRPLMASRGWEGAGDWALAANAVAPTLVGGSKKHGGPDLGPTRAKEAWRLLGVDARGLANEPPGPEHEGLPRLTVEMCALLQGFPSGWQFAGGKTNSYRQVGNAFPPPVARALGLVIRAALQEEPVLSDILVASQVALPGA